MADVARSGDGPGGCDRAARWRPPVSGPRSTEGEPRGTAPDTVTSGWEAQAPSPEFGGGGAGALDVYRTVFVWRTAIEGGTDEFRYSTSDPDTGDTSSPA